MCFRVKSLDQIDYSNYINSVINLALEYVQFAFIEEIVMNNFKE